MSSSKSNNSVLKRPQKISNNASTNKTKKRNKKKVINLSKFSFIKDIRELNKAEEYFLNIAFNNLTAFKLMIEQLQKISIALIELDGEYYPVQYAEFWYVAKKQYPDIKINSYISSQVNTLEELKQILVLHSYLTTFSSIKMSELKSIEKNLNDIVDLGFKFSQHQYAKILGINQSSLSIAAKTRAENTDKSTGHKQLEHDVFNQNIVNDFDSMFDW
ncbi:hypothetical protein [Colwellia sp. BRX8-9]|uniref:hypothetical protein n=1 Tax=Colwellia sp. BRX8-9 TaxID=2759831 RepID=UPI0015F6632C|nr:hypothetical protein [Colwellia sp. BRX8-9]MBA6349445.1 hypothetical protein [Colwellia sp. BRX8-9]